MLLKRHEATGRDDAARGQKPAREPVEFDHARCVSRGYGTTQI